MTDCIDKDNTLSLTSHPCPPSLLIGDHLSPAQFHDGLGFLISHSLLTNTFEYSLQLVNPKLTLPYWDFTFESSTMGGASEDVNEPQSHSEMFTPKYFGSHDGSDQQV